MAEQPSQNQIPDNWDVVHLRATTFLPPRSIDQIAADTSWETVVGNKPEQDDIRYLQTARQQNGILGNSRLIMTSLLDRVDWTVTAPKHTLDEPPDLSTIGSLPGVLESFLPVVKRWLDGDHTVHRLAFGAELARRVADVQAGYKEILQFLPNLKLDDTVADLSYQINRPKKSVLCPLVTINRLSKWYVTQTMPITLKMDSPKAVMSMRGQSYSACRLELDINTAPSDNGISKDDVWPVFEELVRSGSEIACKGDVS